MLDSSYVKIILTDAMRMGEHTVTLTLRSSGATIRGKVSYDDPPARWSNNEIRLYGTNRAVDLVFTIDSDEVAAIAVRRP